MIPPILRSGLALLVIVTASACTCGDDTALAEIGRKKVTTADLEAFVAGRTPGRRAPDEAALTELSERVLFAEAARQRGLHQDPVIRARIAAAEREILAHALLEAELDSRLDGEALRALYQEKRESLERRRVHVRQIMFRLPPEAGEGAVRAAESKAAIALARLADDESFEEVAKDLSDDAVSAARGGDVGVLLEGQVDPVFFDAAYALRAGEVSGPVRTPFGLHVIRAEEAPGTEVPTFAQVEGTLAADARRAAERALVKQLRNEIEVELHPERLPKEEGR